MARPVRIIQPYPCRTATRTPYLRGPANSQPRGNPTVDSTNTSFAPSPTPSLGLHEPFLKQAAEGSEQDDGDLGLGAFLTLRLADQFSVESNRAGRAAVEYQCSATKKFVEDIRPHSQHTAMLSELVRVAEVALESNEPRLLFPPLLAFAYGLEEELRLDEALDVLETALRLSDGRGAEEELEALLHQGRVLRNSGEFCEARNAYERARAVALSLGNKHSELLSRIGHGIVARQAGNLPDSELELREVITESQEWRDRDAEARASQDLAGTLYYAGRVADAEPFAFRAYELFDNPCDKARALSDAGAMLKELGHYNAARNAFSIVLSHELRSDVRARTELECLEVSALTGDRFSFERWRQSVEAKRTLLTPDVEQDFELQVGIGFSLFDEFGPAANHLQRAITLAEKWGMGERVFYAERQLAEVRQHRNAAVNRPQPATAEYDSTSSVRDTIERLETLVLGARG